MMTSERITHNLIQGSDEWAQFRLTKFGASEAAAMLGISTKAKRTELLHMKHTGTPREFSDWVQKNILDYGHEVEALARPIVEELIGQDLYPVTRSLGVLSASCDGLTIDDEIAFEHKQWNTALAESVRNKVLPDEYQPQCQQIMLVAGAQKVIFVCSDGTRENMEYMEVYPDQSWFERIIAGWVQFEKDLAAYVPQVIAEKPVGRTPETLPALRVEVTGMVTASNLDVFRDHALAVFAGINRELTTDQHFADAEKTVKWCGEVESRLAAAKEHALSQTQSIDALFKTIDDISAEARSVRLELDKLVTKRKTEIKEGIIVKARNAYSEHIDGLKAETEGLWIALTPPDFAGAVKGKRTVASIQDAVNTVLANAKIEADASAKRIRANLNCLKEDSAAYEFLFSDRAALIGKPLDDLKTIIGARIAEHKAADERRQEAERERIRQEEQAKAQAAVKTEAPAAQAPTPTPAPVLRHTPRTTTPARMARPADAEIIEVLAQHYRVPETQVVTWLLDMNVEAAADRLAASF
ncbi:putative phage-related endonuclease [Paraburkholderia youngii]|uniref:YqaJ viral recombinase family protein n=1 Tax=Paraburkholderia youngii TaxID=2782701 RepID=UPI003D208774